MFFATIPNAKKKKKFTEVKPKRPELLRAGL